MKYLETKRLILRKPKISDWGDFVEGLNDIEVSKNLVIHPYPYKKKDAIEDIKFSMDEWKEKNKLSYPFVIELKSEKKVIGETGIYQINWESKKGTLGYWINRSYWKKGYNLEASIPIIDFAFKKLKLKKIEDSVWSENKASNKTLRRLGFEFEGTLRKSLASRATGKIHNVNCYGLFKKNWTKIKLNIIKKINNKIIK